MSCSVQWTNSSRFFEAHQDDSDKVDNGKSLKNARKGSLLCMLLGMVL